VSGKSYTVHGHKGKQVRDQLHCDDVARLMLEFYERPRPGEVYNIGGGRENSISILETVDALAALGHRLTWGYSDKARKGDHVVYISNLTKVREHFPTWRIEHPLPGILEEIVTTKAARA
jgi:CDP-paratose 2-epimerase